MNRHTQQANVQPEGKRAQIFIILVLTVFLVTIAVNIFAHGLPNI